MRVARASTVATVDPHIYLSAGGTPQATHTGTGTHTGRMLTSTSPGRSWRAAPRRPSGRRRRSRRPAQPSTSAAHHAPQAALSDCAREQAVGAALVRKGVFSAAELRDAIGRVDELEVRCVWSFCTTLPGKNRFPVKLSEMLELSPNAPLGFSRFVVSLTELPNFSVVWVKRG